jgi:hypothetical protein
MTDTAGAAAALEAWDPVIMARIVSWPARLGRHAAVNAPPGWALAFATGTHVAVAPEVSWSISTTSPTSDAGTVPVTDTPPRMNAEAWDVIVTPSLLAETGTLPAVTGGLGVGFGAGLTGPVPPPPEAAKASPGITSAPAPAANNGAK